MCEHACLVRSLLKSHLMAAVRFPGQAIDSLLKYCYLECGINLVVEWHSYSHSRETKAQSEHKHKQTNTKTQTGRAKQSGRH